MACLLPLCAEAGKVTDYIRNFDLNDYALGVAVTSRQSEYAGADNSLFGFPYLTSFRNPAFTDDWLLINDGDIGVRWITRNQWELGVVTRVQTRGFGDHESAQLEGLDPRQWSLELGPTVGYRGWPIHLNAKLYAEVLDRHKGTTGEFIVSLPGEWSWGFLVPSIRAIYMSDEYAGYYYGVSSTEVAPGRPAYQPGAAMNYSAKIRWGYELTEKWLLSGYVEYLAFDDAISNSPIVDRESTWAFNIGVAYNTDLFRPRDYTSGAELPPRFQFRGGVFQSTVNSVVTREPTDGSPPEEIDLEDVLGLSEDESVPQFDAVIRIGNYHRLDMSYFEFGRTALVTLQEDFVFGDETFPAGTTVDVNSDTRVFRVSYGYSLIADAQKELGVTIGLHSSQVSAKVSAPATGQEEESKLSTPLPVVGAYLNISATERLILSARAQAFRMQFDQYEGSLHYINLEAHYRLTKLLGLGIGYNWYRMNLNSQTPEVNGNFQSEHNGPIAFLSMSF